MRSFMQILAVTLQVTSLTELCIAYGTNLGALIIMNTFMTTNTAFTTKLFATDIATIRFLLGMDESMVI